MLLKLNILSIIKCLKSLKKEKLEIINKNTDFL